MKNRKLRLAQRVRSLQPSLTLQITSLAKEMKSEGKDVVNFAAGEPDFDTPNHIKEAAINAIKSGFTKYTPSSGIKELKEAIAEKLRIDNNLNYAPEEIIVSNGAKHSIFNIICALCQKGDEVIIPSPYWVSYPEMVRLAEASPKIVPTKEENNFKLTEKLLKSSINRKTRVIILNSPSNPTGCVYSQEELAMIANIAKIYNLYVISDEIYEKIIYDGNKHVSIASLDDKIRDITITVNGLSKSHAMTGWRIGYLAGPKNIVQAINNLQSHSTSNPSSISQKAAVSALMEKDNATLLMADEFQNRRDLLMNRLKKLGKIECVVPGGAFYAFCNISKVGLDSVSFSKRLLEEMLVATIPGKAFGWDSHIRLSFATSREDINRGMDNLEKFLGKINK